MGKLDFETGDIVRIDGTSSEHDGKTGAIIGARLITGKSGKSTIVYTVKLSDVLSKEVSAKKMILVEQEN